MNGRVQLSLNYVSCAVILLGLAVVLVLVFGLGRWTAPEPQSAPPREAQTASVTSVDTTPPPPPPPSGEGTTAMKGPEGRVFGKYYLVIQNLRGKNERLYDEAYKIVKFCTDQGYPATVREYRGNYIVWSLTPFDSPDDPELRGFALEIEKIGAEYSRQGGNYNFMQRISPGAPLDPMLIECTAPKQPPGGTGRYK